MSGLYDGSKKWTYHKRGGFSLINNLMENFKTYEKEFLEYCSIFGKNLMNYVINLGQNICGRKSQIDGN